MKEIFEFRINDKYYESLFKSSDGKLIEDTVFIVNISKEDDRFVKIGELNEQLKSKDDCFFYSWDISYKYTKTELNNATHFMVSPKRTFEPTGEECGTIYDETSICKICACGEIQIGSLILNSAKIPKLDFSRTIAGEYIVSENFVKTFQENNLIGCKFLPVKNLKGVEIKFYQIIFTSPSLTLSNKTLAGVSPFDFSERDDSEGKVYIEGANYFMEYKKEIYKCPLGHTLGLNLLSQPTLVNKPEINRYDLYLTEQKFGVRRGLLRPEPLYICSKRFRDLIIREKLKGFRFDIVNIQE